MSPIEMDTQIPRELADVILRPLFLMFDGSSWLRKEAKDWMKANVTPIFKKGNKEDSENYRQKSLIFIPRKFIEQLLLETIARHIKEEKIM